MAFFTSDTHFSHARIIELCDRPFADADEMDQAMIERWNAVVAPDDVVYHLGDVALGKIAESLPLVGLLNGYKVLVPGNHDRVWSGEKQKSRDRYGPEYLKVFQEIAPEQQEVLVAGHRVLLCHFPYMGDSQEHDRHLDHRPVDSGLPLIHGHIHAMRREHGRMLNVGVDVNDFTPVSEDAIADWLTTLH